MTSPIRVGEIDGRLHFLAMLGVGGSATVYQARHLQLDKVVAVKILRTGADEQERQMRRFMREARVLFQIDHPNVVKVHSFEKSRDGYLLMVMEFVEGRSLCQELKQGVLQVERAVDIWLQVCMGMKAAHQHGIVHRDLKPSNIMLTVDDDGREQVKVVDFGIARLTGDGSSQSLTNTDSMLGSPAYMSPEQCQAAKVDVRSDVYSLGCVMYECLSGAPPFVDQNAYGLMSKHVSEPVPALAGVAAPTGLERIITKALSKSADDRFQNMQELIDALNESRGSGYEAVASTIATGADAMPKRLILVAVASFFLLVVVSAVAKFLVPAQSPVMLASTKAHLVGRAFYNPDELRSHNIVSTVTEIRDFYKQWLEKYPSAPLAERALAYFYCSEAALNSKAPRSEVSEYRKLAMAALKSVLRRYDSKEQTLSVPELIESKGCLGSLYESAGQMDRAESLFRECDVHARKSFPENSGMRIESADRLATFLHRRGQHEQSIEPYRRVLQVLEKQSPNDIYEFRIHKDLAESLFLSGHKAEAVRQAGMAAVNIKRLPTANERADCSQQLAPTLDMVGPPSLAAECWLNARRPNEAKLPRLNCRLSLLAAAALVRSDQFESAARVSREACEGVRDCSHEERHNTLNEVLLLSLAYPSKKRDLQVADLLPLITVLCDGVENQDYFIFSLAVYRQAAQPPPAELLDKSIAFLKAQTSEDRLVEDWFYVLLREVEVSGRRSGCIPLLENAIGKLKQRGLPNDLHRAAGAEYLLASWFTNQTSIGTSSEEERTKALPLLRSAASYLLSTKSATGPARAEQVAWLLGVANGLVLCHDFNLAERAGREACKRSAGKQEKIRAQLGLASTYCRWGDTDSDPSKFENGLKELKSALEADGQISESASLLQSEIYRLLGCIYSSQRNKKESMESFDRCLNLIEMSYPLDRVMRATALVQKAAALKSMPHTEAELTAVTLACKRATKDANR
ncbi:MAG: serine/threonine-protein kinase [Candidatus Obscuribacterales bacterium]|nr:serine/threonine-protein kinase [Candidatus Obscuribacterales bacterium]